MSMAPWKTCADEWAKDIQRHQDAFVRQLEIEADRRMIRSAISRMKERDGLFLRAFVSVLCSELEPK